MTAVQKITFERYHLEGQRDLANSLLLGTNAANYYMAGKIMSVKYRTAHLLREQVTFSGG